MLVGDVVGEFELVERDRFAHPLFAGGRRVRVDVHSLGHLGVGLAGDQPARVLELVAAVVDGRYVHRQDVLAATLQTGNLHLERRKHSPAHGPRTAAISSHNYQLSLIDPRDGIVL